MEGLQRGCTWVPATPAKQNSTNQKLICTNWQEHNHFAGPNLVGLERCTDLSETGRLPTEILQQKASACYSSGNFVDASGSSSPWVTSSSAGADDLCTDLSFGKLLALAHAGGNTGGSEFNMSFLNPSSLQYQENQQAQKSGAEFDMLNVLTDGSALSRPLFDLNVPPMVIDAASSKSESAQFEPITPLKINKDEASAGGDRPRNKTNRNDGATELHGKKEKSKLISNLLSVESTRLQENHIPDKRGIDEADLIRTPPPKIRRKKHRPKVMIEGQQKRTPKSSAVKPNVSQDMTRFKRKYVRRKGINDVLEGGTNLDNSISQRKYSREKGINIPEGNIYNGLGTSYGGPARYTRSSCRRSLNFNLEGHVKDGSSTYCSSLTCNGRSEEENFNTEDQSRMIIAMEKNDRDSTHGHDHTAIQGLRVSMESSCPRFSTSPNMYPQMYGMLTDQILHSRGKCQIVFSDATHDKEIETVHIGMHSEDQRAQESFDDFIFNGMCLTPETQDVAETVEAEVCTKYKTRTLHNYSQSYPTSFSQNADKDNSKFRLNLPKFCKKMRATKRYQAAKLQYTVTIIGHRAKLERYSASDSSAKFSSSMKHATDGTLNGKQVFEDRFIWGSLDRIRKRRSKGRKRLRDLSSLLEIHKDMPSSQVRAAKKSRNGQCMEILHEPQRCMEVLVAMTTKKRSKRTMLINAAVQYTHRELSTISMGPPLALTWKRMPSVDSITEQLNHLNLDHNLVTEYNAIVPYKRNGDVVAFDGSFDEERRLRPKVDLDDETTRVWKLLLENINSEGIDGTDEENTKRWEDERRVFSGRAHSFIARMRLVQGNRHFSPWKGSVVDSVVGVFLTQNVSDHLSSSAFMSLVAQFPVSSKTSPSNLHEEAPGTKMKEPEVYDPDPVGTFGTNKETLNQSMHGEETKMLYEYGSIKEIDHVASLGNIFNGSVSEDSIRGQPIESSKCSPAMYSEIVANKSESCIEDVRDIESTLSSQKSTDFTIEQTTEKSESCALSSTSEEPTPEAESSRFTSSFEKLLQRAGSILNGSYERDTDKRLCDQNWHGQSESSSFNYQNLDHLDNATIHANLVAPSIKSSSCHVSSLGGQTTQYDLSHKSSTFFKSTREKELSAAEISGLSSESTLHMSLKITGDSFLEGPNFSSSNVQSINNDQVEINQMSQEPTHGSLQQKSLETWVSEVPTDPDNTKNVSNLEDSKTSQHKDANSNNSDPDFQIDKTVNRRKARGGRPRKGKEKKVKWNQLRKQALTEAGERLRTVNTMDSVDWDAVRCANVNEIAQTIKERGMNNVLAQRIKDFLNRLIRDHGSLDLEWLRDVPPDKAKEYLLSIRGLGLKSVECVRLLTLHHVAFPVDTNVGRIAVRLGWVPLQPLPESLQLHLLEMYPILESIQKYLWPRLCKLDQGTLYELHYQMITFGKVFCTKSKPNCNACPMRGECRHFASAFASARFALPAPEEKGIVGSTENRTAYPNPMRSIHTLPLPPLETNQIDVQSGAAQPIIEEPPSPEPIIEVPTTPEPAYEQVSESIIESAFNEELDEIPTIQLNMEEFTHNLQEIMQQNTELHDEDMSKALVALASEAASLPVPKLKNISRLRTEHRVYELPDSHPLLERMDKREPDDPCPYLLAIWTPGETVDSIEPPAKRCKSQGMENLCTDEICLSCNSIREANSQTVRGTLLIPCRTAMRGSFPLNGTYFQVNEVFSDHESSLSPLDVPRALLWNLPRRTVFFGTSIPTIFRGLSTEGIQYCFWRGFVCVRGFDRKTRAPRPLVARLHFPASRLGRRKGKPDEEYP